MSRTTVKPKTYDRSFKLKVVKLFFEDGYTRKIIQDEFKIPDSTLDTWIRLYKLHGESAFYPKVKKLSFIINFKNKKYWANQFYSSEQNFLYNTRFSNLFDKANYILYFIFLYIQTQKNE